MLFRSVTQQATVESIPEKESGSEWAYNKLEEERSENELRTGRSELFEELQNERENLIEELRTGRSEYKHLEEELRNERSARINEREKLIEELRTECSARKRLEERLEALERKASLIDALISDDQKWALSYELEKQRIRERSAAKEDLLEADRIESERRRLNAPANNIQAFRELREARNIGIGLTNSPQDKPQEQDNGSLPDTYPDKDMKRNNGRNDKDRNPWDHPSVRDPP